MGENLSPVTPATFSACVEFIREREKTCVSIAAKLSETDKPSLPGIQEFVHIGPANDISGIMLLSTNGILTHCFRDRDAIEENNGVIASFMRRRNVRCILGMEVGTRTLERLHPCATIRVTDYNLMTLETHSHGAEVAVATQTVHAAQPAISLALPEDAEALLPLQEGYEKEEVIPPGNPFDRTLCLATLRLSLKKQRIHMIKNEGIPIAKAGTNARGFLWDQIGGVYTVPHWRRKGLATALMARIVTDAAERSKPLVLFVKTQNESAQKVYSKNGFTQDGFFRIAYY
jgi:uncharacterized protein